MAGRAAAAACRREPGVEPSERARRRSARIGDIEFWEPNRGALITSGNGSTVKPGVWFYDGASWRELSNQCGATDGRIAWAGPDEFWTVSDGRAGPGASSRAPNVRRWKTTRSATSRPARAAGIEIVASYASPPFLGELLPGDARRGLHQRLRDCWFGGDPLPEPQIGAFQLHWNGHRLEPEPFLPEGHAAWDMRPFEGAPVREPAPAARRPRRKSRAAPAAAAQDQPRRLDARCSNACRRSRSIRKASSRPRSTTCA